MGAAASVPESEAKEAALAEETRMREGGMMLRLKGRECGLVGLAPVPPPGTVGQLVHELDLRVAALYSARGLEVQHRMHQQYRVLSSVDTGASIEQADIELFIRLCALLKPRRIFGVGNAFGFSTFVLSYACGNAPVDVIDAGIEGEDNDRGTLLTRRIATEEGRDVQVHVGFSPQHTYAAMRGPNRTYDLAFIDGMHTDRRFVGDFLGLRRAMSEQAVVVFHDTGWYSMWAGARKVLRAHPGARYRTFEGRWAKNRVGTGFAYWGFDIDPFEDYGPELKLRWRRG